MISVGILGFESGELLRAVEMFLVKVTHRTDLHVPLAQLRLHAFQVTRALFARADDAKNDLVVRANDIDRRGLSIDRVFEQCRCGGNGHGYLRGFCDERPACLAGRDELLNKTSNSADLAKEFVQADLKRPLIHQPLCFWISSATRNR